jgi:hypothetical protein
MVAEGSPYKRMIVPSYFLHITYITEAMAGLLLKPGFLTVRTNLSNGKDEPF